MHLKNIKNFINAASQDDIGYVVRRAKLTYEYFVYHIATGRKVPSENAAAELEKASFALSKRKPKIPVLRCTDFIDSYQRCPHDIK